jgi:hypothetical protein
MTLCPPIHLPTHPYTHHITHATSTENECLTHGTLTLSRDCRYSLVARAGDRLALGAWLFDGSSPTTPSARPNTLSPFLSRVSAIPQFTTPTTITNASEVFNVRLVPSHYHTVVSISLPHLCCWSDSYFGLRDMMHLRYLPN